MTTRATALLKEVLALPDVQRAEIAEKVLHSLDRPDPQIDALWAVEARARIAAFESGELEEVSEEEFFSDSDAL